MKKKVKFIIINLIINLINIPLWMWLAYLERGHGAVGGEYLCIIACALAGLYITAKKMEV